MEILEKAALNIKAREADQHERKKIGKSIFKDISNLVPDVNQSVSHWFNIDGNDGVGAFYSISTPYGKTKEYPDASAVLFIDGSDTLYVDRDGNAHLTLGGYFGQKKHIDNLEVLSQYRMLIDQIIEEKEADKTD